MYGTGCQCGTAGLGYRQPEVRTLGKVVAVTPVGKIPVPTNTSADDLLSVLSTGPTVNQALNRIADGRSKSQAQGKSQTESAAEWFNKPLGVGSLTVGHGIMGAGVLSVVLAAITGAKRK